MKTCCSSNLLVSRYFFNLDSRCVKVGKDGMYCRKEFKNDIAEYLIECWLWLLRSIVYGAYEIGMFHGCQN